MNDNKIRVTAPTDNPVNPAIAKRENITLSHCITEKIKITLKSVPLELQQWAQWINKKRIFQNSDAKKWVCANG